MHYKGFPGRRFHVCWKSLASESEKGLTGSLSTGCCLGQARTRASDHPLRIPHSAFRISPWSRVPGSRAALSDLCKLYWYPLYAFIRRRGCSAEDAQDLTQGFFLSLLDRKALRQVTPLKGKFRSFLLASLQNYLSDQFDRRRSLKRGGNIEFVPLDFESGDERYRSDPHEALTAEKLFDARGARTLLDQTLSRPWQHDGCN